MCHRSRDRNALLGMQAREVVATAFAGVSVVWKDNSSTPVALLGEILGKSSRGKCIRTAKVPHFAVA